MSKKSKALAIADVATFVASDEVPTFAEVIEALPGVDAEVAADIVRKGSVVRVAYKKKYAERNQGLGKQAQRSCWDWLAQELASEALTDSGKLDEVRFRALLDANGVKHEHWARGEKRTKGWEGRLRMTGRLALQKVVAAQGHLVTAEGAKIDAPADWIAKFTN